MDSSADHFYAQPATPTDFGCGRNGVRNMFPKKLFLLTVVVLMLPIAVFANSSVSFTNVGGTLSGTNSGLSLSGSTLASVTGLNGGGLITGNLGTVTLSTGALVSGSLAMGGTLAGGGAFTITGNGTDGLPNGVIFSGTFDGPVTWSLITLSDGTHQYTLTGVLVGSLLSASTNGVTMQLTVNTGTGFFNGSVTLGSGDTNIQTVPEPSSLSLFGAGILSLAGIVRRKRKR
jgi:hypothetical protein